MRLWTRALLVGAVGLGAGGAVGCAEERPPINRVQPNALAKSFFVGEDLQDDYDNPEFWAQGTVIDVGYGAAQDGLFTSTYAQPVSRIKWQVTEDLLIGRLAYERIADSDGKAGVGNATTEGQIAYIYPIQSHFDIRRDYNPTTGEESNVVVENSSDRPWDQREFMRVDWSRNLNTDAYDFDTLSLIGVYGGVSYEPVSYYVNDPDHADAPVFDVEDGYFDITNKALATPGLIDLSHLGWGIDSFPSCYLENDFFGGTAPAGNCNPVEITLRQAFRKVEKDDFEPQNWDGRRFQAAGAFYIERNGYARNYGMVDEKWHRFISRYDIWERSHYYDDPEEMTGEIACNVSLEAVEAIGDKRVVGTPYGGDPHRDLDNNGTEDECEAVTKEVDGVAGSRCDEFKQKCTLPYQVRQARPVVWNYTKNSNQKYFEGTEWAAHEWDVAMRVAVQAAKYAECTRVKALGDEQNFRVGDENGDGLDDECVGKFPLYSGQQDDNQDAIALAHEVDACRNGHAYKGKDCDDVAADVGALRGYQPGVVAIARQPEMVVLCHGPVEANDPEACGEPRLPADVSAADCDREWAAEAGDQEIIAQCNEAKVVRIGDLRYHQINSVKTPQTPSPWGIYTDSEDPLWGNKIAASINIWTHVNDLFAQGVVDTVRYIQGELPTEEITDGKYVTDWAAADEAGRASGAAPLLTRDQVDGRLAATTWQAMRGTGALAEQMPSEKELVRQLRLVRDDPAKSAETMIKARPVIDRLRGMKADPTAPSVNRPFVDARRIQAQNTATEAAIVTPAMQQLSSVDGAAGLPAEAQKEFSSLFRGLNPNIRKDIRQAKEAALAARGACMLNEAPSPTAMTGLSNILVQKFGDWRDGNRNGTIEQDELPLDADARTAHFDRMKEYIAQRAQYAVIIHEMGHSIGLRHNFVSSSNAWGYRPQYWQLRTKNSTVTNECHDLTADGGSCVGPRYYDPPTDEEQSQLIQMFMQSSVMDYAGEQTQDLIGLGAYDFHAARMFYGEVMSVHADDDYRVWQPRGKGMLNLTDSFGGIYGYQHNSAGISAKANGNAHTPGDFVSYSKLDKEYGLLQGCTVVGNNWDEVEAKFKPADWNDARDGRWHPVIDGQIVAVDGIYSRCRQRKVDYVAYDRMRVATTEESEYPQSVDGFSFYGGGRAVDPIGRTRVPYAFASDNWADTGNVAVFRHDNGADVYELFNFLITEQETRHIFDNYRRGRLSFSVRSSAGRILGRYNEKMRDAAKGLGLIYNLYRDLIGYEPEVVTGFFATLVPDNLIASGMAFDHFTRQLQRPQSGPHLRSGNLLVSADLTAAPQGLPVVTIPDGATGYFGNVGYGGKLLENRLADDQGDFDSNYTMNAGSYYDKLYVPYLLTESADNFISDSIDDFMDARYRSVSMADLFPAGFQRLMGTMLTQDEGMKGAFLEAGESGSPIVDFQSKIPTRPLGWTSFWTPEASVCFPGDGSTVCASIDEAATFGNKTVGEGGDIARVIAVSPNVDWELWKFLIVQTMLYLPENSRPAWINQLGVWEVGADTDPAFPNRIELHSHDGKIFVAATSGRETILGKSVEKGIAARMLEYGNSLLKLAYETRPVGPGAIDTDDDGITDAILDEDGDGVADLTVWFEPIRNEDGTWQEKGFAAAQKFQDYQGLLLFLRQTMMDFRMADPTMKGLYD